MIGGIFIINIVVLLKKFKLPIKSFCKECGRDVHGFSVSDYVWDKIELYIEYGNVLCYDCLCEYCSKLGLPSVWNLTKGLGEIPYGKTNQNRF